MNRRGLLSMLHCAKRDLGLDEDTYRLTLENLTGKRSAAELGDGELGRVIDHFRKVGWVGDEAGKDRRSKNPHIRLIWALWFDLGRRGKLRNPTRAALRAFVAKRTGVTDPEWLSVEQANTIIECLKVWLKRTGTEEP